MNRHTATGRFVSGKSTGTYRGQMRHDPSTEEFKSALHTVPSRDPVAAHAGTASVNTDAGAKPHAHDTGGPNSAANAATNARLAKAGSATPPVQPTPGQLVAAGVIKPQ